MIKIFKIILVALTLIACTEKKNNDLTVGKQELLQFLETIETLEKEYQEDSYWFGTKNSHLSEKEAQNAVIKFKQYIDNKQIKTLNTLNITVPRVKKLRELYIEYKSDLHQARPYIFHENKSDEAQTAIKKLKDSITEYNVLFESLLKEYQLK